MREPAAATAVAPSEPDDKPMSEEELKAAIRQKNPGFGGDVQIGSDGTRILAVAINDPAVKDISPLQGLSLQAIDLSKTSVADISPLKGMPLADAYFAETEVADLRPLQVRRLGS